MGEDRIELIQQIIHFYQNDKIEKLPIVNNKEEMKLLD